MWESVFVLEVEKFLLGIDGLVKYIIVNVKMMKEISVVLLVDGWKWKKSNVM